MTKTIVESKTKTAIIGFDQPFCVIGERINPTGRKKLALELEAGDFSTVEADAIAQVLAGATVLDINSGAVFSNKMAEDPRYADNNFVEPPLMKELVERVQAIVDVPLCIDSSVPGALESGLEAAEGRPLLNSVTGEEERLEMVLPLVKKYNVPVVAISNDDTGISEDPDVRFAVAKKIVECAADFGIPAHDIVVDPLVMPIGAMATAGLQVFTLVRRLRESGVTIILTTHYIEEAEEIADRVGVINNGELLLIDDKQALMHKLGKRQLIVELEKGITALPEALAPWTLDLSTDGSKLTYTYDPHDTQTGINGLLQAIGDTGLLLKDIQTTQSSLEEIFVGLVKGQ